MSWYGLWAGSSTDGAAQESPGELRQRNSQAVRPTAGPSLLGADARTPERVFVRVYDLGRTCVTRWHNKMIKSYGIFHTGVEVYGREWCFGMTFDEWSSGITWHRPGMNPDHTFRETLSMGFTHFSPKEVIQIIEEMQLEWRGNTYSVLSRNCHNFSDTFCRLLGVGRLPQWVNDLADAGTHTAEFLDGADSGYDGGAALFGLMDGVARTLFGSRTQAETGRPRAALENPDPFIRR